MIMITFLIHAEIKELLTKCQQKNIQRTLFLDREKVQERYLSYLKQSDIIIVIENNQINKNRICFENVCKFQKYFITQFNN